MSEQGVTIADTAAPELTVQPREIEEYVYRALCADGADPSEAHIGAAAVLRAEAGGQQGLGLFPELLAGNAWHTGSPPAARTVDLNGALCHELSGNGQPALRSMVQLMDLAAATPPGARAAAYSTDLNVPVDLWNDLLIRCNAQPGRRTFIIFRTPTDSNAGGEAVARTIIAGRPVDVPADTLGLLHQAVAGLITPTGTALVIQPEGMRHETTGTAIPPQPLTIRADQWHRTLQAARKYLVSDS